MPNVSTTDIASFTIANAAAGPEVARAFLLQGSLGANGRLITAKLIADQFAAMQAQLTAAQAAAASAAAQPDKVQAELDDVKTRLERSENDLQKLEQDHAALTEENAAFGDAAVILARLYRSKSADDAQWAGKLKQVRAAMDKSDSDHDAMYTILFLDGPEHTLDRFMFQIALDDGTVDQAVIRDFHAFRDTFMPMVERMEQRHAALLAGKHVPAETVTLEFVLSELGKPAANDPPAADAPAAEVPVVERPSRKAARKAAKSRPARK
jgi:hypothetical protein